MTKKRDSVLLFKEIVSVILATVMLLAFRIQEWLTLKTAILQNHDSEKSRAADMPSGSFYRLHCILSRRFFHATIKTIRNKSY